MTVGPCSVLCLLLATRAPTQGDPSQEAPNFVVVPHWRAAPDTYEFYDNWLVPQPLDMPTHQQYAYDVRDFGVTTANLTAVSFRTRGWRSRNGLDYPMVQLQVTVSLWHAPFGPNGLQAGFAANGGPGTVVFSGGVGWPGRKYKDPARFVGRIPFRRPFLFDRNKGKSLVMDVRTQWSSLQQGYYWTCAAAWRDRGNVWAQPPRQPRLCWNAGGGSVWRFYPGGAYAPKWEGAPKSAHCFASFGFAGYGATWFGKTLPIDLYGRICLWGAASVLFLPFRTDARGVGQVTLPIPDDPRVIGLKLYDQTGCVTPGHNPIGLVTFVSAVILIGSGHAPNATWVAVNNDWPPSKWAAVRWPNSAVLARFELQ